MNDIWEPWTPRSGQVVRIHLSAECNQDWDVDGGSPIRGHAPEVDGTLGAVIRRLPDDDPYAMHHPYKVAFQHPVRCDDCGEMAYGGYFASAELTPIGDDE